MKKRRVIIGLLGTKLDSISKRKDRWSQWRPTVATCQQSDLTVDRLELLYERKFKSLADQLAGDIESISPETDVRPHPLVMDDPWDFEEVYGALHDFSK